MPAVREYVDETGKSPFATWFDGLSAVAAAKVTSHVARLAAGNLSNVRPVGGGVHERRIDWGPGLRVYFANDGQQLIILFGGSDKGDQQRVIAQAQKCWRDYKRRK